MGLLSVKVQLRRPGGFASLYKSGPMRPFLDTEVDREGGRGGPKLAPWDKVQSWPKFGRLERAGILK
jgi:hypothetical protein